ncbi:transposase [Agathobacter rectalis]|uniref:transposase n=1 Tax=Agathobacter rectalis TaxID=39491 RepID=UPI0027D1FAB4
MQPIKRIQKLFGNVIYHLRWGIETSFRELKYAIGLTSFHARKPDFIKQEIYARLLLYNYCELITTHVIKQMKNNDKTGELYNRHLYL